MPVITVGANNVLNLLGQAFATIIRENDHENIGTGNYALSDKFKNSSNK